MSLQEDIQRKIDLKTKPLGSLGKLEKLAMKIAEIQQTLSPSLKNPLMLVFAADHGLTDEGISPFPKEVTYQMVMNFIRGGAAISVFCKHNAIALKVIDAGVDFDFPGTNSITNAKIGKGTKNILQEPAMTVETCLKAMRKGREIMKSEFDKGSNIVGFGEMGIGNTSSAALLMSRFTGIPIEQCVGRGTGLDDQGLLKKKEILKKCIDKYSYKDPVEILATFGGFEIAMMCGAMLEAQKLGMVLLIDGFIATSALLAAQKIDNAVLDNCIFCHESDEQGHKLMLEYLKAEPLLNLGMRLGEGTGAALAYPIVKAAVAFLNEMASFEEAHVSNK